MGQLPILKKKKKKKKIKDEDNIFNLKKQIVY